jgi:hypothetical protein
VGKWIVDPNLGFTNSGSHVRANPILDTKILSKSKRWKKEVPKVSPNFQNRFVPLLEITPRDLRARALLAVSININLDQISKGLAATMKQNYP